MCHEIIASHISFTHTPRDLYQQPSALTSDRDDMSEPITTKRITQSEVPRYAKHILKLMGLVIRTRTLQCNLMDYREIGASGNQSIPQNSDRLHDSMSGTRQYVFSVGNT